MRKPAHHFKITLPEPGSPPVPHVHPGPCPPTLFTLDHAPHLSHTCPPWTMPPQAIVDLAVERQQELPALVYEARPVGRGYQRGHWNRADRGEAEPTAAAAAAEQPQAGERPPSVSLGPLATASGGSRTGSGRPLLLQPAPTQRPVGEAKSEGRADDGWDRWGWGLGCRWCRGSAPLWFRV